MGNHSIVGENSLKLTDEIRQLDRKKIQRNPRLRTACHEAAHALMHLYVGFPFISVRVKEEPAEGHIGVLFDNPKSLGRVVSDPTYKIHLDEALDAAKCCLAGHCFGQIISPRRGDLALLLTGSSGDYLQAVDYLRWAGWAAEDAEKMIDHLCPDVRRFLVENWGTLLTLGERLAKEGELAYEQVKVVCR